VVFAVMENDIRRLLAYHIVSQVGYMVCGVGIGTEMALNGATAHAFCHLIYKALLFMGTGAVLFTSGREKLTELGGLARAMPLTLLFYMVGALSIAGAPLFNGFISKSLVVAAAAEDGRGLVVWMLQIASVGTFLSVALKLPYFAWFGERPAGIHAREAPRHMLLAMGGASALCVLLGVVPGLLYSRLPFPPVDYRPYTAPHVFEMLLLMAFTGVGFRQLFARLVPHDTVTLDTDWFYRRPAAWFVSGFAAPLDASAARLGARFAQWRDRIGAASRNPPVAYARWRDRLQGTGDGEDEPVPWFDEDRQRVPVAVIVLWVLSVVGVLALFSLVP
jgi:multicomponent Na+:H+ antiporter subunit D